MGPASVEPAVTILLVSPDLMVTSRLAGLAREIPARLETLRSLDGRPESRGGYRLVLVDLGAFDADPAVLLFRIRAALGQDSEAVVAAFGPHVAKERLANAVAAGADHVVSRGEILGSFASLVRQWCGL